MNRHRSKRSGRASLVVAVVVAVALVALIWFLWPKPDDPNGVGVAGGTLTLLELNRTALAATENLEVESADESWVSLRQQLPEDESVALNQAINRVLRVDTLAEQAINQSLTDEEKQAARRQLPNAISSAREAIDEFGALTNDQVTSMWLRARIDLHEATLLPGSMTKSLRREVYARLSESINGELGDDPRSIILGGTLIGVIEQLEDPLEGVPEDLLAEATQTVGRLSEQHADNLLFALRAARLSIDNEDSNAIKYVRRAQSLASAIEPSIVRETAGIGFTPKELVQAITDAINQSDWDEARTWMLAWFNVLNPSEIVKTDRRRASPHPLDRLSFDALRRLSSNAAAESPLAADEEPLQFKSTPFDDTSGVLTIQAIDYDLDLDPDLVSLDDSQRVTLWSNNDTWTKVAEASLSHPASGMIVADLFLVDSSDPARLRIRPSEAEDGSDDKPNYESTVRHETIQNVIAYGMEGVSVVRVDGRAGTENPLSIVDTTTGLEEIQGVTTAVAGDLEADGDIDLVFATESDGVLLLANRGNRTFFEISPSVGDFSKDDPIIAMEIADLDRDLDLDVVTLHASGKVGLLENLLHLQYRGRYLEEIRPSEGATSLSVQDVDGNVSWDLVITGQKQTQVVFSQTADASAWTVERTETVSEASPNAIIADLNNDTWVDVLSISDTGRWCTLGPWGVGQGDWQSNSEWVASESPIVADMNRDGKLDLAAIHDGKLVLYTNESDVGHHLKIRFRGIDDNKSGRVNHYAIGSVMELRFGPHYRAQIVNSPVTQFGLDGFEKAGTLRVILPNGLTQTIRDPEVDALIEEQQTLKGSCPYLYAWDGEKFVFKTDCLWAAPLGLQVAAGIVAKDRPWEYLKIDGSDVRPNGDCYEFRITEELWEIAYFDKVALTVVDHPANVDVWTNEKVGPAEIAEPTIFAFEHDNLHDVDSALDTKGQDVSELISRVDKQFVQGFDRRLRQGLCEPHWIDLDFHSAMRKELPEGAKTYLVLTGWILPTDTSLNIQIDQNPDLGPIEFPSVWVPDDSQPEGWRQTIPFMGFPGGKTKTIVVDVTDSLIASDPRLRIRTSAQIYWDCAQLAIQTEPAEFDAEAAALVSAEVAIHGYSRRLKGSSRQPEWYDYEEASLAPRWPPLRGRLTQLGDCMDLVSEWDDRMVVISGGDEVRLRFSIPKTPIKDGWVRDFVLHSVGWDKDADLNTLAGQSSLPIPYREMTEYPPLRGSDTRAEDLLELNRDHLQRTQSFRAFWHR